MIATELHPALVGFYESQVLPALFERLDRAFPEQRWARHGGQWAGQTGPGDRLYGHLDMRLVATQPWGYYLPNGHAVSWLTYVGGGQPPTGEALVQAIYYLADVAGVAVPAYYQGMNDPFAIPNSDTASNETNGYDSNGYQTAGYQPTGLDDEVTTERVASPPSRRSRRVNSNASGTHAPTSRPSTSRTNSRVNPPQMTPHVAPSSNPQLAEDFLTYCRQQLAGPAGAKIRTWLEETYGLTAAEVHETPLGLFTSSNEIRNYLEQRGHRREDIAQSSLVSDARVDGRLIVPWRSPDGELKTVVGVEIQHPGRNHIRCLYLSQVPRNQLFGLDVALQPESGGREQLVLVDDLLDVVYLQHRGIKNVAAVGSYGKSPTTGHWEHLASLGVKSVTLAQADNLAGRGRTRSAVEESVRSINSPHVFALPLGSLEEPVRIFQLVRQQGVDAALELISNRIHAYRYVAWHILERHNGSHGWNDSQLVNVIDEAVAFDTSVVQPAEDLSLERFFWPTIVEATGTSWSAIESQLAPRVRHCRQIRANNRFWRRLRKLHEDLHDAAAAHDVSGAREILRIAAAEQWPETTLPETEKPRIRSVAPATLPFMDPATPWASDHEEPELREEPSHIRISTADVRRVAYQLWEKNGQPVGRDQQFWFEAEQIVRRCLAENRPLPVSENSPMAPLHGGEEPLQRSA